MLVSVIDALWSIVQAEHGYHHFRWKVSLKIVRFADRKMCFNLTAENN